LIYIFFRKEGKVFKFQKEDYKKVDLYIIYIFLFDYKKVDLYIFQEGKACYSLPCCPNTPEDKGP
jgi:hypothetical protein